MGRPLLLPFSRLFTAIITKVFCRDEELYTRLKTDPSNRPDRHILLTFRCTLMNVLVVLVIFAERGKPRQEQRH